jgi:hypothetical protein
MRVDVHSGPYDDEKTDKAEEAAHKTISTRIRAACK